MQIFDKLTYINNSSLALGFFDGLHQGHEVVLKNAVHIAKKYNECSTVITFNEHPMSFLSKQKIPQILTLDEKLEILEKMNIDNVVLLDFSKCLNLSAEEYLRDILVKYFSPVAITTGFNHTFGYNKEGNGDFLRKNSQKYNYQYFEIPPFVINNLVVSCSSIRDKLSLGDFYNANKMLGYNYFIKGNVVHGDKIASKLGFPSANINFPDSKVTVPFGVYYAVVRVEEKEYNGIFNYGYVPDLNNELKLKSEVHILDFNQDIYGYNIKISFITKIRNQIKFQSSEELIQQINKDISFVNVYKYFLRNGNFNLSCKKSLL